MTKGGRRVKRKVSISPMALEFINLEYEALCLN